jgi:hypothetical protein
MQPKTRERDKALPPFMMVLSEPEQRGVPTEPRRARENAYAAAIAKGARACWEANNSASAVEYALLGGQCGHVRFAYEGCRAELVAQIVKVLDSGYAGLVYPEPDSSQRTLVRTHAAVAPIKAADDDYDITHTVPGAERVRGKAKVRFVEEPETLPYW